MKIILSSVAIATMMLATAACTSSGSNMQTQSGGSNATAEKTSRGVPTLPAQ
jgi:hypothetical protein